jgi:hypothetical protein
MRARSRSFLSAFGFALLAEVSFGCSTKSEGATCGRGTKLVDGQCVSTGELQDASNPPTEFPCDAGSNPAADAAPATVVVAFSWVYFETSHPCYGAPVTCGSPGACPPTNCTCQACVSPPCIQVTITPHCCSPTATIRESDLVQLVRDYPTCALAQTSPSTYTLKCPMSSKTNTYWTFNDSKFSGDDVKYATDRTCTWSLPYAL